MRTGRKTIQAYGYKIEVFGNYGGWFARICGHRERFGRGKLREVLRQAKNQAKHFSGAK